MSLELEFEEACRDAIGECKTFGYNPTVWQGMINDLGAVEAAKRLLLNGDVQPGFDRLVTEGRSDLTIEEAVLNPRWTALFDERHREAARWRLEQGRGSDSA